MGVLCLISLAVFSCVKKPYVTNHHRNKNYDFGHESEYYTQYDSQSEEALDKSSSSQQQS